MSGSMASTSPPLSLHTSEAHIALVPFVVDGARCALPLAVVERVFAMPAVASLPSAPPVVLGVVNVHGELVPVLDVRVRFGHAAPAWGPSAHLLLARTPRRTLALPVDEVLGVLDVPATSVVPPQAVVPHAEYVAGLVALPDGLLFIHDLDAFLALDEEQHLRQALAAAGP